MATEKSKGPEEPTQDISSEPSRHEHQQDTATVPCTHPTDHWTHSAYSASAPFVPILTSEILTWLSPQPTDTILDLGCGDGILTFQIAQHAYKTIGVDASTNMIAAARTSFSSRDISWHVVDCRYIEESDFFMGERYDKVFSNAALHWILRDEETRLAVLRGVYKTLKRGGSFVFEMGGAGNVADVHTALLAALVHQGVAIEEARRACPWFFPSEQLMTEILGEVGFVVEKIKAGYRPTKLTVEEGGGLEGWVRLMGAQFLEVLPEPTNREAAVREVCDVLKTVVTREEDGSMWLGYVRLKVLARKV